MRKLPKNDQKLRKKCKISKKLKLNCTKNMPKNLKSSKNDIEKFQKNIKLRKNDKNDRKILKFLVQNF